MFVKNDESCNSTCGEIESVFSNVCGGKGSSEDIPQNATVQLQQDSLVDLQIRLPAELPLPPQTLENTD
ncbi:MAG: hypothetical protein AAFR25_05325, partial [Cyanobacteria bacterium J06629_19]